MESPKIISPILVLVSVTASLYLLGKVFLNAIQARKDYLEWRRLLNDSTENANEAVEGMATKVTVVEAVTVTKTKKKTEIGTEARGETGIKAGVNTRTGTGSGTRKGMGKETVIVTGNKKELEIGTESRIETDTEIVTRIDTQTGIGSGMGKETITVAGNKNIIEIRAETIIETSKRTDAGMGNETETETETKTSTATVTEPKNLSVYTVAETVTTPFSESNTSNSKSNDDDEWEDLEDDDEEEEEVGDVEVVSEVAKDIEVVSEVVENVDVVGLKVIVEEDEEACHATANTTCIRNNNAAAAKAGVQTSTITADAVLSGGHSNEQTGQLLPLPIEVRDLTMRKTGNVTENADEKVVGKKVFIHNLITDTVEPEGQISTSADAASTVETSDEQREEDLTASERLTVVNEDVVGKKVIVEEEGEACYSVAKTAFTHNTSSAVKPGVQMSISADADSSVETSEEQTEPLVPLPWEVRDCPVRGRLIEVVTVTTQLAVGSEGDMGRSSDTSVGSYEYADSY